MAEETINNEIKKTKDKYYKEFGYIECLELYIAVKLLKDV